MKTNRWLAMAEISLMCLAAGAVMAQPGGVGGFGGGGFGGSGAWGSGSDTSTSADQPMDQLKSQLNVTDDAEWNVLQPLIQKVIDAQAVVDADAVRVTGMTGRSGRNGNFGGGGGFGGTEGQGGAATRGGTSGGTTSQELQAVQRAVSGKASNENTDAVLVKLAQVRKSHLAALATAQDDLRKVLTIRQEAVLVVNGCL